MRFAFKPLLIVVTAINVFLFVSLFGHKGEGRPIFSAYVSHDTDNYRLSDLYLLQKVINQVERDYVYIERIKPVVMFETALDHVQRDIPEVLFRLDVERNRLTVVVDTARKTFPVDSIDSLRALVINLRTALEFADNNLYTDLPLQEVAYSAINGILSTLDPHSILLPPEIAREMDVQIQGEFGGLGITISLRGEDNLLTSISTLPDTPASEAGRPRPRRRGTVRRQWMVHRERRRRRDRLECDDGREAHALRRSGIESATSVVRPNERARALGGELR